LQVWVAAEYRGANVAWDLMDAILTWAGDNNFHKIMDGVIKGNTRALKFYIKYGFTVINDASKKDAEGVSLVKEV